MPMYYIRGDPMSLKPIELQIALPRTQNAGAIQQQLIHKPVQDQEMLAAHLTKKSEEMRKKSTQVDGTQKMNIEDEKEDDTLERQAADGQARSKKKKEEEKLSIEHPYKGHHIDFSL
jgi:hypothetical protein